MTDKNVQADITRAHQAQLLLDNPLYIEAVTAMRAAMFIEFESSRLDSPESRHDLWQRMQLMRLFQGKFEEIVKLGKRAQDTIKITQGQ